MHMFRRSLWVFASSLVVMIGMSSARADTFQPKKFLQDAAVITSLATAVAQLAGCEEDLVFSEHKNKDDDGEIIAVVVTCNKMPDDAGKLARASVRIELELNDDGSVGPPLSFAYD